MNSVLPAVIVSIFLGVFLVVAVIVTSLLVMLLWNWLMPQIFGLKKITFLQALGLQLLISLLFCGVGGGPDTSKIEKLFTPTQAPSSR